MNGRLATVVSRWRQVAAGWASGLGRDGPDRAAPQAQSCPGLARCLTRWPEGERRPHVLDLGSRCGQSAVFLADRGARVTVEELPLVPAAGADAEAAFEGPLGHPDDEFDVVLGWELLDFVAPAQLGALCCELRRILAPGGWLLLLAEDAPLLREGHRTDRPRRYRIVAEDKIVAERSGLPDRPRWFHPNRAIERALAPLAIQGIHLQRNRVREFLAAKPKSA